MIKDTNNIPKAISGLKQLNNSKMRAGILDGGEMHMIAHVQEYGAHIVAKNPSGYLWIPTKNGKYVLKESVTIPARSFIARTVIENSYLWRNKAKKALLVAIQGGDVNVQKSNIARRMNLDIVKTINSGNFTANSGLTISIKGSNKPLVDTGGLRAAVRNEVER